jgi:hypothetical protein
MRSSELLSDSQLQAFLIEKGQQLFPAEKLIREPTVVFDRGGLDEFWAGVMNSERKEELLNRVRSGHLVPITAEALSDLAQVHTAFHVYIAESGRNIPTIPTIVNVTGKPVAVGTYRLPREIPGVAVKKVSFAEDGKSMSHRGRGVSVVQLTKFGADSHLPKTRWEFLQPFVVPPDRYVRDIRAYLVGGEPVAGSVRRAQQMLSQDNLDGKVLPAPEQYPSAHTPGSNERLEGILREKVFHFAREIGQVLDAKMRSRVRPFSPLSTFGFGSIDFLLDANETPLPVDFDICPSVTTFDGVDKIVAQEIAKFLEQLSTKGGVERKIMVIGHEGDPFVESILATIKNSVSSDRVAFQTSVTDQIVDEKEKAEKQGPKDNRIKIGRNEPCSCGSGQKYKYCHGRG